MQVLIVCSGNGKYGISPIIKNQAESLIEAGINIDFFPIKGKGLLGYLKNIFPLRKVLRENNYQIIHAHYGSCGLVALLAKRKEKVTISFMGSDILFTGDYKFIYKIAFFIEVTLNRLLACYFYDKIILKSVEMSDKLPEMNRKVVIPNGVNLDLFKPVLKEEARNILNLNNEKVILFSSDHARPEKNYILAKKAFDLLKCENLKLIFLKGIDQKKIKFYYSSADVLLMTSFHEGSPNVIKEAMACNCPIVSTDVGDVRNLLDGIDGCFICSYDPSDVAEKIRKALAFPGRTYGRQKLIDMGLDQKTVALQLKNIYSELVR